MLTNENKHMISFGIIKDSRFSYDKNVTNQNKCIGAQQSV